MNKPGVFLLLLPILVACSEPQTMEQPATLVIVNGHVWTGDATRPRAEAVAVRAGRIVAVGSTVEIESLAGPSTRTIDANGALVTPGFIDSHIHFLAGGFRLASVQLRDAGTREEFAQRIGEFAKEVPEGTWITGGDWDHHLWGGELPHREWIDKVTPKHPVWVSRLDGHMALANSLAIELAGVTSAASDIEGGSIVRDRDGTLTGVFKDNAMNLFDQAIPEPPKLLEDRALDAAMRRVAEQGVTSVQHMGSWNDVEVFGRARDSDRMITRIYAAVPLGSWERLRDYIEANGSGDDWLRVGALKEFVDGSLGSHTAAFLEPYTDTPDDSGFFINDPEQLREWVRVADSAGLHLAIHAIGDRAIRDLLDIFASVAEENGEKDRRFRIEHAQHIHPDDLSRFAALGVIASMQPYHAIDDGRWADEVIGSERAKTTYAFRSLLDSGARVAFGSDWHVAPPTPLEGIYGAVTRRTLDDQHPDGWVPGEKITLEEALVAYTRDAAFASFEETSKGALKAGLLADLVVLDRDLFAIAPETIRDARVRATIVGGRVVYEADRKP